ncbi:MAG: hypothetical protein ACKOJF_12885, partial [Planctomycetaceae bacterium]
MPTPDMVTRRVPGRSWRHLSTGQQPIGILPARLPVGMPLGFLVALLWLAGWLPGGLPLAWADAARDAANWEKLKSLTATEREQVQRNLKRFRELSEDKKWALRKLRT